MENKIDYDRLADELKENIVEYGKQVRLLMEAGDELSKARQHFAIVRVAAEEIRKRIIDNIDTLEISPPLISKD